MKSGRYIAIPENPADLSDLWRSGEALAPETAPSWAGENAALYRRLGCAAWRGAEVGDGEEPAQIQRPRYALNTPRLA